MANKLLWAAESGVTLLDTELNSAADAATIVDGADYDNATNKFRWASFLLNATFAAACNAGSYVELHIFYKLDGTNYGDGEDGDVAAPVAGANSKVHQFNIGADAGPVFQQAIHVPLAPFAFRAALKLVTGQAMAASDNTLKMYPYNEEGQ